MITLFELERSLAAASATTAGVAVQGLRHALESLVEVLHEEIRLDSPTKKEARRQLRIETETLLSELAIVLQYPTETNRSCVEHRLKVWNELLQQVQASHRTSPVAEAVRAVRDFKL